MFELKWEKNIQGDFLCGNKNGIKKKVLWEKIIVKPGEKTF